MYRPLRLRLDVPQLDRGVIAASDHEVMDLVEGHRVDVMVMFSIPPFSLPSGHVPHHHGVICPTGKEELVVLADVQAEHFGVVALSVQFEHFAFVGVPESDVSVSVGGHHVLSGF